MKKFFKAFYSFLLCVSLIFCTSCDLFKFNKDDNSETPPDSHLTLPLSKTPEEPLSEFELDSGYNVTRRATTTDLGDYAYVCNDLHISIRIIPTCFLTNIEASISFFNSKGDLIELINADLGHMRRNTQYIYEFELSDNAFTKGQSISRCIIEITAGTAFTNVM